MRLSAGKNPSPWFLPPLTRFCLLAPLAVGFAYASPTAGFLRPPRHCILSTRALAGGGSLRRRRRWGLNWRFRGKRFRRTIRTSGTTWQSKVLSPEQAIPKPESEAARFHAVSGKSNSFCPYHSQSFCQKKFINLFSGKNILNYDKLRQTQQKFTKRPNCSFG